MDRSVNFYWNMKKDDHHNVDCLPNLFKLTIGYWFDNFQYLYVAKRSRYIFFFLGKSRTSRFSIGSVTHVVQCHFFISQLNLLNAALRWFPFNVVHQHSVQVEALDNAYDEKLNVKCKKSRSSTWKRENWKRSCQASVIGHFRQPLKSRLALTD